MNEKTHIMYSPEDIEKNKLIAGLAYFIFFLPLIVDKDSEFGKFHANQGLLLLLVAFIGNSVLNVLPIIGWVLIPLFSLLILVFAVIGLLNALNGNTKELPLIGHFVIIK